MEPLLSVVVPSYNAEAWLERCVDSLVVDGGEVEVIIVDDGSTDSTLALATDLAARAPGVVVVHQDNKGHGGAVNTGVAHATGTWLKVCDADDALDPVALRDLLARLRQWDIDSTAPDLVVTNFVYVREGSEAWHSMGRRSRLLVPHRPTARRAAHAVRFHGLIPEDRVGTWDDVGRFRADQYLMMHALLYRTEVLRASGTVLPEHCFYVDSVFAFEPLTAVRSLTYLDLDLYLYTIGREGQSVADDVIVRRLDQHDRVNALMLEALPQEGEIGSSLYGYLLHYYLINCVVISTMALRSGTEQNLAIKEQLWTRMAERRPDVHRRLRRTVLGRAMNLRGPLGRRVPVVGYHVARRALNLN
ncbi:MULTISPECIES: glycosyltransferase family 2 protein [Actinomyces]|uniref:Glycosyltransferase family 2 protein n=1 Tax=Actinomyces respiraculi TaxID=2744574 RepID=A0A7T0PVE3_9ACTO|nr:MULTISPECIES: glycosyltransferase family 2 protein [Actinomyces]QPL04614.1 glycosyltransferase family 2 protein [Actinomyces respiraculi]